LAIIQRSTTKLVLSPHSYLWFCRRMFSNFWYIFLISCRHTILKQSTPRCHWGT